MIRSDYDIQTKGIHFFNIIDLEYEPEKHTPVSYYNSYRTTIVNNLAKNGDIIKYKNNERLENDEKNDAYAGRLSSLKCYKRN